MSHESSIAPFGVTSRGEKVSLITLRDERMSCGILTYGGAVAFLNVPERDGATVDVVLGFDDLETYENQDKYIGALIGRHANRIAKGQFTLDGRDYQLARNDGNNHLHGGNVGFDKRVWQVEKVADGQAVLLLHSPDGEEGYPGNLDVRVTYTLKNGALAIRYQAQCDADTLCNLTNHTYFNLGGHSSGNVLDQTVQLFADKFTPADRESLPVGTVAPVEGTPMDLRTPTPIGASIDSAFDQLEWAGGYDHNWVVNGQPGVLRPAARAYCQKTGVALEVDTTLPGIQFYTGNYLGGVPIGKGGVPYGYRWGFCLESQFFPNAMACPAFQQPILRKDEHYDHTTVFRFSAK